MYRKIPTLRLFLVFSCLSSIAFAQASGSQSRGLSVDPDSARPGRNSGSFYALVIGIDHYRAPIPSLKTAANDAQAMANTLSRDYGFRVQLLMNEEATRSHILGALAEYARVLGQNDSLLIYYAGHGYSNPMVKKTYWLPSDANEQNTADWIIADEITTNIRVQPARHVLIISDSCYAGGLSRDAEFDMRPDDQEAYLQKMQQGRSRTLMASGGDEPVSDSGANGHSVFAKAVLHGLDKAPSKEFTARDLFDSAVRRQVAGKASQIPQYTTIRDSDDENGDFVFIRSSPNVGHLEIAEGQKSTSHNSAAMAPSAGASESMPASDGSGYNEAVLEQMHKMRQSNPDYFVRIQASATAIGSQGHLQVLAISAAGTAYDVKVQLVMKGVGSDRRTVLYNDLDPGIAPGLYTKEINEFGNEAVICYTAHTASEPTPLRVTATYTIRSSSMGVMTQVAFVPTKPPTMEPASDAPCGGIKVTETAAPSPPSATMYPSQRARLQPPIYAARESKVAGVFADSTSGLLWTVKDNGADVGFPDANRYCSGLRLGGYSDWRLPTMNELSSLYDQAGRELPNCKDVDGSVLRYPIHIRSDIQLGCYSAWSSTPGRSVSMPDGSMATMSTFDYFDRRTYDVYNGIGYHADHPVNIRALCVRAGS